MHIYFIQGAWKPHSTFVLEKHVIYDWNENFFARIFTRIQKGCVLYVRSMSVVLDCLLYVGTKSVIAIFFVGVSIFTLFSFSEKLDPAIQIQFVDILNRWTGFTPLMAKSKRHIHGKQMWTLCYNQTIKLLLFLLFMEWIKQNKSVY